MFANNVFRPPPTLPEQLVFCDDVTYEDSSWAHLSLLYDLFLKLLECKLDLRILQFHITPRFMSQLFSILTFPDQRERFQAKGIIESIFINVSYHRPLIRLITSSMIVGIQNGMHIFAAGHLLSLSLLYMGYLNKGIVADALNNYERLVLPLHIIDRCESFFQIGRASCRERVFLTV